MISLTGTGALNGRALVVVVGAVGPKSGARGLLVHDVAVGV